MQDVLAALYDRRFNEQERRHKQRIWQVLCRDFFAAYVPAGACVLELGCGFGDFINAIAAGRKLALDANAMVQQCLAPGVQFINGGVAALAAVPDASVGVVFASNFFEHLRSIDEITQALEESRRVLAAGGRLIVMGPNIRHLANTYWDFFDHRVPLSDKGMAEGITAAGFRIERREAQFLPYTTKGRLPSFPAGVHWYLRCRWLWPLIGKQFLIIAVKPS